MSKTKRRRFSADFKAKVALNNHNGYMANIKYWLQLKIVSSFG